MPTVLALSEQTKRDTHGYFDIVRDGRYDPSGIVKGWAVHNAAHLLEARGFRNFYVDAGGDVQVWGKKDGQLWRIGVRNPFNRKEHVKVLLLTHSGLATPSTALPRPPTSHPHHP